VWRKDKHFSTIPQKKESGAAMLVASTAAPDHELH
jgi:hypothetical protein